MQRLRELAKTKYGRCSDCSHSRNMHLYKRKLGERICDAKLCVCKDYKSAIKEEYDTPKEPKIDRRLNTSNLKTCAFCKEIKPRTEEFFPLCNRNGKGKKYTGFHSYCKTCRYPYRKAWINKVDKLNEKFL